jgi:hypothetical protein
MKLQIVRISDRGIPNKERLHLNVLQDAILSNYIVLSTKYASTFPATGVMNGGMPAFWFPTKLVRAGDQIVLQSGSGMPTTQIQPLGTVHYFFWGFPTTIWNDPASCAVVAETPNWVTSLYNS